MVMLLLTLAACQRGQQETDQAYVDAMTEQHAADAPVASPAAEIPPAVEIASQEVTYGNLDGRELKGYLAYPAEAHGALPGVLVFHEWWGLNDNIRAMADQLAGQGYVALAVDLFDGQVAQTPDAARALLDAALGNRARLDAKIRLAYTYLEQQTQATSIGTIGWCFGGGMSLRAAQLFPDKIDATVIYYGHVDTDTAALEPLTMPILAFFGAEDQGIPVELARQFEQALHSLGKRAEVHIYEGAGHAFANPSGQNYRPGPAEDAWRRTLAFFDAHLNAALHAAPTPASSP
ncbi:MAG TPA: dienelactone hydrolase family protein [Gammaproteobacteria bacterium]|nr:dienelactone hydrolase family protein [Gammaproteobacteria bacterium]